MSKRVRPLCRTKHPGPGQYEVLAWAVLTLVAAPAWGQSVTVIPTVTLTETLTDNRNAQAGAKQADLISQFSPGVSITARRGALQGSLTYALNGLVYARASSLNNVYHSLSSVGNLQLLDGRAGINATASAGRQVISAFGTQASDSSLNTGNQAQVFSYSLSPYLSGRLLGDTGYRVSLAYSSSSSDAGATGDSSSLNLAAGLTGRLGQLGWSADATRSITDQGDLARSHTGRVGGSLNYAPDIELQLSLRLGSEVDDLQTGQSTRTTNWGAGATWVPGPRTSLRFDTDRRFFGRSHSFNFSHRMARTIWSASDSRSLNQTGTNGRREASAYDQLYAQLASVQPDPVQRDALVRALLAADPTGGNRVEVGGFQSQTATVQRTQNLAVAYQGLRATLTVSANRSDSRPVAQAAGPDFALASRVQQQGLSLSLSHRLTSDSSIVASANQQRTAGSGTQPGNNLRTITATWSARLGPYTNVSLGLRHSQFDSEVNPYQESAIIGTIRMQF